MSLPPVPVIDPANYEARVVRDIVREPWGTETNVAVHYIYDRVSKQVVFASHDEVEVRYFAKYPDRMELPR